MSSLAARGGCFALGLQRVRLAGYGRRSSIAIRIVAGSGGTVKVRVTLASSRPSISAKSPAGRSWKSNLPTEFVLVRLASWSISTATPTAGIYFPRTVSYTVTRPFNDRSALMLKSTLLGTPFSRLIRWGLSSSREYPAGSVSWRPPRQAAGLRAMRESAVHATWPRSVSRRSWSFWNRDVHSVHKEK